MLEQDFAELQKTAAEMSYHAGNMEKQAFILGTLGLGALLHVAPNVAMKVVKSTPGGHNALTGSFAAGVDMGKGGLQLQHNWKNALQYGIGPESLVEMRLGQQLGSRMKDMDPTHQERFLSKLRGIAQVKMNQAPAGQEEELRHVPIVGTFMNYMDGQGSEKVKNFFLKRTVPEDQKPSLLNRAGDLAMLGGAAAVDPHLLLQPAISAARKFTAESEFGKNFMKKQFENGKSGKVISKARSLLTDLAVSPSVLDPYRIGRAANEHMTPEQMEVTEHLVRSGAGAGK